MDESKANLQRVRDAVKNIVPPLTEAGIRSLGFFCEVLKAGRAPQDAAADRITRKRGAR